MGLLWWSTALIGVLTAVVYVMYRLVAPSAVRVVAGAGALRDHVLAHCPSLQSRYLPALFAWNGHLMAIIATTMHKQQRVPLRREELTLPDGGAVALDWVLYGNTDEAQHHEQDDGLDQDAATRPVVLFLHGLVGSSKVNYMQHTLDHLIRCLTKKQQQEQQDGSGAPPAAAASSLGQPPHHWRLVVMNARGCGGTRLRSPRGFHAGDTDDVRYVVQLLHERFPRAPLMAVSFSLGANILTKYLGEEADKSVLHAAVAVSNPWNLSQTDIHMRSTSLYRLYNRKMCGTLVDWYRSHQYAFDGLVEPKTVFDAKTIRDFDAAMVVPLYNFNSVEHYYESSSSIHKLPTIRTPLLALNALDDPVCPPQALPDEAAVRANPNVLLALTERGSHTAWLSGWNVFKRESWADQVIYEYLDAMLQRPQRSSTSE